MSDKSNPVWERQTGASGSGLSSESKKGLFIFDKYKISCPFGARTVQTKQNFEVINLKFSEEWTAKFVEMHRGVLCDSIDKSIRQVS